MLELAIVASPVDNDEGDGGVGGVGGCEKKACGRKWALRLALRVACRVE